MRCNTVRLAIFNYLEISIKKANIELYLKKMIIIKKSKRFGVIRSRSSSTDEGVMCFAYVFMHFIIKLLAQTNIFNYMEISLIKINEL